MSHSPSRSWLYTAQNCVYAAGCLCTAADWKGLNIKDMFLCNHLKLHPNLIPVLMTKDHPSTPCSWIYIFFLLFMKYKGVLQTQPRCGEVCHFLFCLGPSLFPPLHSGTCMCPRSWRAILNSMRSRKPAVSLKAPLPVSLSCNGNACTQADKRIGLGGPT